MVSLQLPRAESNEADGAGSGHVEGTAEGKLWKS